MLCSWSPQYAAPSYMGSSPDHTHWVWRGVANDYTYKRTYRLTHCTYHFLVLFYCTVFYRYIMYGVRSGPYCSYHSRLQQRPPTLTQNAWVSHIFALLPQRFDCLTQDLQNYLCIFSVNFPILPIINFHIILPIIIRKPPYTTSLAQFEDIFSWSLTFLKSKNRLRSLSGPYCSYHSRLQLLDSWQLLSQHSATTVTYNIFLQAQMRLTF